MKIPKKIRTVLLATGALLVSQQGFANDGIEIVASGQDGIFLNQTNARYGYHDLVLHNVGIRNSGSTVLELESVRIDVLSGGDIKQSRFLPLESVVGDTRQLASNPLPIFTAFQLLDADGLPGFFGDATELAGGSVIGPGEGLVSSAHHFSLEGRAEAVRVSVRAANGAGETVDASLDIPVIAPSNLISYHSPVRGAWFMRALPVIESHHRLNAATEYAVDFFKLDSEGRAVAGDRIDPENYPGFGQPVFAAADGTVVYVEASAVQDRTAFLPREGESGQERGQRLQRMMMQAFQANPRRAAGGNLVTIRHDVDGHVEYSSYGHLKAGSVAVKVGDTVNVGQQIAEVGDTGDSPAVHLHFQVNSGPDAFTSKSLPFRFEDIEHAVRPAEPGFMIRVSKEGN